MNILSFSNVSFSRNQKKLLADIYWEVKTGEHWAILGLNGAGKTLLLQLMTGNLWPSKGSLTVLGYTFGKSSIPELNEHIGWVSDRLHNRVPFHETSERIVLSGKFSSFGIYKPYTESDLAAAKNKLALFNATSLCGKTYQQLSQGERQIVLIARALMANPRLLILDEPCNGLDLFAREELLNKIRLLIQQPSAPTLIFVTHHTEEILPEMTHLLMLKKGSIFQQGPLEQIFTEPILKKFYERPVEIHTLTNGQKIVQP